MTTTWSSITTGAGNCAATITSATVIPLQLETEGPTYDLLQIVINVPEAAPDLVWSYGLMRVWQSNEASGYCHLDSWQWSAPTSGAIICNPPIVCGHFARADGDPDYPYNLIVYPRFYVDPEDPSPHYSRIVGITTDMAAVGHPYVTTAWPQSGPAPLEVFFSLGGIT